MGFRMGNTCTPMAGSCECMAKTTTILQSNQLPIKIKKKKKAEAGRKGDWDSPEFRPTGGGTVREDNMYDVAPEGGEARTRAEGWLDRVPDQEGQTRFCDLPCPE